jgi:hypothetical protein
MTEHPTDTAIPIMLPELRLDFSAAGLVVEEEVGKVVSRVATEEGAAFDVVGVETTAFDVELLLVETPCAQVPFAPFSPATQPRPFFDTHPSSHTVTDAKF